MRNSLSELADGALPQSYSGVGALVGSVDGSATHGCRALVDLRGLESPRLRR
jgi:hypothetical protein